MSVVITSSVVYGPFKSIEVLTDRLCCDDVHYPFSVIGSYTVNEDDSLAPAPLAPEEPPHPPAPTKQELLEKLQELQTQINALG